MAVVPAASRLDLVVRFSTSNADVVISVTDPAHTSALSLKLRIRVALSPPAREGRLRLIHAGKVIDDRASLTTGLGNPAPPTSRSDAPKSEKAKGKLPARSEKPSARVYIHCSIGDALSATELQEERVKAAEADLALQQEQAGHPADHGSTKTQDSTSGATTTTTPAPQGFDRLLSAGFTAAEIATLRTQFRAIQAHSHTPDTMPVGEALLALEERWLEQSNNGTGGTGAGMDELGDEGLDDLLWGTIMGFFWPVGMVCWLLREEGLWSRRRQMTVMIGFFINVMFGFMRVLT